jgi:F420-dependent oxidoreductase-like protein
MAHEITLPALIVVVGPSGSGKTTWAQQRFSVRSIVSSDELRGRVGVSDFDQQAGGDAFAVLEAIVAARLRRKLTTVVDTLGLDPESRRRWVAMAHDAGLPAVAVHFDTPPAECRTRNKQRTRPVPAKVLTGQIERYAEQAPTLADDGFDDVLVASTPIRPVTTTTAGAAAAAESQSSDPVRLSFGLQVSSFDFDEHPHSTRDRIREIGEAAEEAGFTSLWVMDHFIQIPQVGREWNDMLEAYTTLAYLAGVTSSIRLGTLVTGIGYRNPALLGKMLATLDVLSGGRMNCGLGAGWFERETLAYGWEMEPAGRRLDRLEDTLQMLPLLWGPGSPSFEGKVFSVPEAICYPRPIQEHIPILVGGSGEKRTLRLVAEYADAANLFGDPDRVRAKLDVLDRHCEAVGRDRSEIDITHLAPALVADDADDLAGRVAAATGASRTPAEATSALNAATIEDHIGRYRLLADAGVTTAIVAMPNLDTEGAEAVARLAPIIETFR